jgi:hypothetical protein
VLFLDMTYTDGQETLMTGISHVPARSLRANGRDYYLLDVTDCEWPDCDTVTIAGLPTWAPGGMQMILWLPDPIFFSNTTSTLLRADSDGQALAEIGSGGWPFWLDAQHYGFLLNRKDIVWASTSDDDPQNLIALQELIEALPPDVRPDFLEVEGLAPGPEDNSILAIVASARVSGKDTFYFFLYDHVKNEITYLFHLDNVLTGVPTFSPDGRWLVARSYEPTGVDGSRPWSAYIFDLDRGEIATVVPDFQRNGTRVDWSADSQWLLRNYDGFSQLIAPGYDVGQGFIYRQSIAHPRQGCTDAVWINR